MYQDYYDDSDEYETFDDPKQNGRYEIYEDDKLKLSYNLYEGEFYGKCIYYNSEGNIQVEAEINPSGFSRTMYYDDNGKKKCLVICGFDAFGSDENNTRIIKYQSYGVQKYITFTSFYAYGIKFGETRTEYYGNDHVHIFHYNNNRVSYREKNDDIVAYYMNGYTQNNICGMRYNYKNKKMLFY